MKYLLISFLLILFSCHTWENNVVVDGVSYKKFRYTDRDSISIFTYSIGLLEQPITLNNISYEGYLHRYNNGVVSGGLLAKDQLINSIEFKKGCWVSFYMDGSLKSISPVDDRLISGHLVNGTGGGVKGARIGFYPSGELKYFFAPENIIIDGFYVKGSLFSSIVLHKNGALKSATLSKDRLYNGESLNRGDRVELSENGRVVVVR